MTCHFVWPSSKPKKKNHKRIDREPLRHHDHITTACEGCEVFGVARIGEIGAVFEGLFVDGSGADGGGMARLHQINSAGDDVDYTCGIGGIGNSSNSRSGKGMGEDRKGRGGDVNRLGQVINDLMHCALGQVARIA